MLRAAADVELVLRDDIFTLRYDADTMAGDEAIHVDITSTAVCRILTVSTSRQQALALVNRAWCCVLKGRLRTDDDHCSCQGIESSVEQ